MPAKPSYLWRDIVGVVKPLEKRLQDSLRVFVRRVAVGSLKSPNSVLSYILIFIR